MPQFSELAGICVLVLMLVANVIGAGLLLGRLAKFVGPDLWVTSAAVGGAGLSALGYEMWLLGYLNMWGQLSFSVTTISILVVSVFSLKNRSIHLGAICKKVAGSSRNVESAYLGFISTVTVGVAFAACFRPSSNGDEIAYHWPAPLLWASMHHWVPSPYRFTNGPSFVELTYLPSALFQSVTSGHLTHLLMWLVLLISCCALSRLLISSVVPASPTSVTTSVLPTLAAVIACPVITTQASIMANDLGASAYIVASLAVLYSTRKQNFVLRQILLSAFIFCGAVSSKQPFALGVLPLIVLYLWFGLATTNWKDRVVNVSAFLLPCLITESLWLMHTYSLIGKFVDVPVAAVWTTSTQPTNPAHPYSGVLGLAGPPSAERFLALLMAPFVTWLIGNQEPFGNRTGLVVPLFLPVYLFTLKASQAIQKRIGVWLFATSAVYFIGIGIFVVRTRYHMIVWTIWSLLASIGYSQLKNKLSGRNKIALTLIFLSAVTWGCADSCRTLLQHGTQSPQILPQIPWLLK